MGKSKTGKDISYIVETENCVDRLKQHQRDKDFWDYAIVVISKDLSLTKTHVKYLKYYSIQISKEAACYSIRECSRSAKSVRNREHESRNVGLPCHKFLFDLRELFIETKVIIQEENIYCFIENYIFSSPSTAGGVILGISTNEWTKLKNTDCKTLNEVKRHIIITFSYLQDFTKTNLSLTSILFLKKNLNFGYISN